jgi:hypothetical protein
MIMVISATFNNISASGGFVGGENRSTRKKTTDLS